MSNNQSVPVAGGPASNLLTLATAAGLALGLVTSTGFAAEIPGAAVLQDLRGQSTEATRLPAFEGRLPGIYTSGR